MAPWGASYIPGDSMRTNGSNTWGKVEFPMEFPRGELLNTIESKSEIISPQPRFELGIYGMPFSRNDTELHQ